jgi:hypothetical protein
MRTVTTAAERQAILAGKKVFISGRPLPQRYCNNCGEFHSCVKNPILTKDPRRHYIDETGRIWFGNYCPECWTQVHYDRYRDWIEKRALRLGLRIPRECGPGGFKTKESGK